MQSKRFYWLKLQEHFFQDKAVKKLRRMPNGDTCVMIYLKMLLLSLSSSGELYFDGLEPDFHTELALTLDEDEELVRDTLEFLMRVHRLEQKSETVYYLPEVGAVTGSESASAERMRKARQKPADAKPQEPVQAPAEACDTEAAHCDTPAAHCDVEKEIEKELEIEKETESDAEKELFPESQTVAAAVPETTTTTGSRKKDCFFQADTGGDTELLHASGQHGIGRTVLRLLRSQRLEHRKAPDAGLESGSADMGTPRKTVLSGQTPAPAV